MFHTHTTESFLSAFKVDTQTAPSSWHRDWLQDVTDANIHGMGWTQSTTYLPCHESQVLEPASRHRLGRRIKDELFIRVEYDYTCQIYIDLHLLLSTRADTFPVLYCRAVTIGDIELAQLSGTNWEYMTLTRESSSLVGLHERIL